MLKDRLKKLRSQKSISQRDLANALKLSPSTIAMYEVGQREPDSEILNRIADYFNVTTDYLLGRTDEKNEQWWEKDETPSDIDLEDFIKNNSNIKLMGNPLDEKAKKDVLIFLRAAHQMIKEKRKAEKEENKDV